MLLFEHKQHYQSYNAQSSKIYINPAPGNTQPMLRRGRVVV